MMSTKLNSFNRKLLELNQWQTEQGEKLKEFQNTQKKLIGEECKSFSNNSNVQTASYKSGFNFRDDSNKENNFLESIVEKSAIKTTDNSEKNHFEYHSVQNHGSKNFHEEVSPPHESCSDWANQISQNENNNGSNKKREFLKRGDGLARFRMTLEDFKHPPKIYKTLQPKKRIKKKCEVGTKGTLIKGIHSKKPCNKELTSEETNKCKKNKANISVDIYIAENKLAKNNSAANTIKKINTVQEVKKFLGGIREPPVLKLSKPLSEKCKENECFNKGILKTAGKYCNESFHNSDNEKKNDEKELRVFEILEEKINEENSFCSSPSLIDRLMSDNYLDTSAANFKIKSFQKNRDCEETVLKSDLGKEISEKYKAVITCSRNEENCKGGKSCKDNAEKTKKMISSWEQVKKKFVANGLHENDEKKMLTDSELKNTNDTKKKLFDEFEKEVNNSKLSFSPKSVEKEYSENVPCSKNLINENDLKPLDKTEMAMKLRRKGLQDNVKQLMNWDCSPRKKFPKKVVKKLKPKTKKKAENTQEQTEKVVFSSALLKDRLNELEKEILAFRKENAVIEKLRKECLEEKNKLVKERKEFEKQMREEREKFEIKMAEDRKKLQKERNVFETYCKQTNNRPTRQEREEIVQLKKQLEKITETSTTKEARWAASQARLRNQIRNLEKENLRLTTECAKLKKSSAQSTSSSHEKYLSAKVIRVINSELEKLKIKTASFKDKCNCQLSQPSSERLNRPAVNKPLRRIKSAPNIKRNMSSTGTSKCNKTSEVIDDEPVRVPESSDLNCKNVSAQSSADGSFSYSSCSSWSSRNNEKDAENFNYRFSENELKKNEKDSDNELDFISNTVQDCLFESHKTKKLNSVESDSKHDTEDFIPLNYGLNERGFSPIESLESNRINKSVKSNRIVNEIEEEEGEVYDKVNAKFNDDFSRCHFNSDSENLLKKNKFREKVLDDGTREIVFPNGNVKKVSPDNKIVRMLYYNGDVKEINSEEGSEKYYYCETQTWHTTYNDGMEVFEFPTGQTERRYANGSSEISFPNGCVRYCDPSGRDEWRFLDGTVMKTDENGHKILLMANGQKEIQTSEFKQREYPDGTIKILYANGTQETRYASGRVRLKDGTGNLIMDSGGI